MKIVIDMQGAQTSSRYRGIGRYTLSLTKSLLKNKGSNQVILLFNALLPEFIEDIKTQFGDLISQNDIHIWYSPSFLDQDDEMYEISEHIREEYINALNPDLLIITSLFEGYLSKAVTSIKKTKNNFKTAVILYDLIPFIHQEHYLVNSKIQKYYFSKIEYFKKADFYFAISDSSKNEAIKYLSIDSSKIVNIQSAVDDIFKPQILANYKKQQLFYKYNIKKQFIMYVPGGFDYRKNFKILLEAYSFLPQYIKDDYQLLLGSKVTNQQKDFLLEMAKEFDILDSQLIISGYIPDSDLINLYSSSDLFIFPSLHEGFGLPLLEAMSCKTVVIGSNTSSIPEVIQNENQLFNPNNPNEISSMIIDILSNADYKKVLLNISFKNSKKFSWQTSAEILINFIVKNIDVSKNSQVLAYLNISNISNISKLKEFSNQSTIAISKSLSKNNKNLLKNIQ